MTTCRGIDCSSWDTLQELVNDDNSNPVEVASVFAESFETMLKIDRDIAVAILDSDQNKKELLSDLLNVYDKTSSNAVLVLKKYNASADPQRIKELKMALRYSALPEEMISLAKALEAPNDKISLIMKADEGGKVTDSLKDLIKKYADWWWLVPILDAIDEVLDLIRGGTSSKSSN